jgi:hypothetical protein
MSRRAEDWIIRNNYDIQCLLEADKMKELLILAYQSGKDENSLSEEDLDRAVEDRIETTKADDYLTSYKDILL